MALAVAAYTLARERGLANARVPDIAAAAGVSTRTFNNYFSSKEQAVAWPAGQHAGEMAINLRARPADEPLADALIAAVTGVYREPEQHGLPPRWLRGFRELVAAEPSLHGEYLRVCGAAEQALVSAIAERQSPPMDSLRAAVLAGMTLGAERAAVRHWMAADERTPRLVDTVREGLRQALCEREALT